MSAVVRAPASGSTGPLTSNAAARVGVFVGVGFVLWLVSWARISGEAVVADQVNWVSLNVLGVGVAFFGQVTWLLRARSAVGRRARYLLLDARAPRTATAVARRAGPLVAAAGSTLYHRSSCPVALATAMEPADEATHAAAGRTACGICRPAHV